MLTLNGKVIYNPLPYGHYNLNLSILDRDNLKNNASDIK